MESRLAIAFLVILSSMVAYHQAEAKKGKARSLLVVLQEVDALKEKLEHLSTGNGSLPWEPVIGKHAFLDDEDFALGVLPDTKKQRASARRAPPNRKPPLKPGETKPPAAGRIKLPKAYNARDVYGYRCPSFNHIMYQGSCGNCWAVASTALVNDRTCMYLGEKEEQKFYSAKHMTQCLKKGCDGGWFADALQYWITDGLVTGGDYRQKEPSGCKPYPKNTTDMKNATCATTCDDGNPFSDDQKTFGGARYEIKSKNPTEIMAEIYMYGPVIATFDVYDDLAHYYKKGVYKRVSTKKLGGHACKLYGWGVENNVPFWYASNSWGSDWGDGGFFKIQRGTNECNVETNIHAAVPAAGLYYSEAEQAEANA